MADTRCANPEYQLEVDTMMVEYVIYKATEAQSQLLRYLSATQSSQANGVLRALRQSAESATRLTDMGDTLINLFYRHHGRDALSENTRLDVYLLKFLVLLTMWLQSRIDTDESDMGHISSEMKVGLQREMLINSFFRRRWLRTRAGSAARHDLQNEIHGRQRNPQLCLADHLLPKFLHLSEHLLPHFMHLSYKMQPANAELSEKWMSIAAGFMIQAAIEVLDAPDLLKEGPELARLALEECFAWGYVQRHRFANSSPLAERVLSELEATMPITAEEAHTECKKMIEEVMALEDDCWEMFFDQGPCTKKPVEETDTPQSSGELSHWTRIRQESLDTILTAFADMQEDDSDGEHVQWLRNQYRLSSFLLELAEFLTVSWENLHSPEWHGKPILIQIEEGGLQGLNAAEFEQFMVRAQIQGERYFT